MAKLTDTTEAETAAMQYFKEAQELAAQFAGGTQETAEIPINAVGIIGAGTMGGGIAMNMANVEIPVIIVETKQDALERGLDIIRKNYLRSASRGRISAEEVEQRCALIQGSLQISDLADCDLVIEAVFENIAVKKEIFTKLDSLMKAGAILASNTSALDLNEIASATDRPESVIGLHFFSPANVMKLVEEIILTFSEKTGATRRAISDSEILKRCIFPMINEGAKILEEGIAIRASDIDVAWVYGYGWPMFRGGPMYYANSIGLDKVVATMRGYAKKTGDPRWQPCDLVVDLAERGQQFT